MKIKPLLLLTLALAFLLLLPGMGAEAKDTAGKKLYLKNAYCLTTIPGTTRVRHMCLQSCDGRAWQDKEGIGCGSRTNIQMSCTSKPANARYHTPAYVISSWNETAGRWLPSPTATYSATAVAGECRFTCDTNYVWDGSACTPPPYYLMINSSSDASFMLPIKQGAINDLFIDRGDGQTQTLTTTLTNGNGVAHTYANANTQYTITLRGTTYLSAAGTSSNGGKLGFGFLSSTVGYNTTANKNKVLRTSGSPVSLYPVGMALGDFFLSFLHTNNTNLIDPVDLSPLANWNVTSIGNYFLYELHYMNTNLTDPVDLTPLANWSVTSIGNGFLYDVHNNNHNLNFSINLSPLANWKVTSIGDDFLAYLHAANTNLTASVDLSPLADWNITRIGDYFLNRLHSSNTNLITPINLQGLKNWNVTSIGNYFLAELHDTNGNLTIPINLAPLTNWRITSIGEGFLVYLHYGNTKLTTPINLSPLANWRITSIENDFLYALHSNNTNLTTPIDLAPLANWSITRVGNEFLADLHSSNTSLTTPINLAPLVNWDVTSIGANFLSYLHYNNTRLTNLSPMRLPNWVKKNGLKSGEFYQMFYLSSANSTSTSEPTFMDGTPLSNIGIPSSRLYTYYNRTGLNGYASLHANRK